MSIPNIITLGRIILVPVIVWAIVSSQMEIAFAIFVIAGVSDAVDGFLAKRFNMASELGALLDPLADKALVLGGFFALGVNGDFSWVAVILVTVREVGISIYRSFAGRRGISLPARQLGKWKAVLQFLAVGVVLFPPMYSWATFHDIVLWVAVAVSLLAGFDILRRGWAEQQEQKADNEV